MNAPNGQNGNMTPRLWVEWILVVALASGAGFGGAVVLPKLQPDVVRPDPFTGTMGRELEARVMAEVKAIDAAGSKPVRDLQARVQALESSRTEVVQRLSRIEELLIEMRVTLGQRGRP